MRLALAIALVATACAGEAASPYDCQIELSVLPVQAYVSSEVRIDAVVIADAGGVPAYDWLVRHAGLDVPFEFASPNESAIRFTPATVGPYTVTANVTVPGVYCPQADATVNVSEPGVDDLDIRLHVVPPPGLDVPPIDEPRVIPGGGDHVLGDLQLPTGRLTTGTVTSASGATPAYLRFIPAGQPGAVVEVYTNAQGMYSARVQNGPHDVLVVPDDPAKAPALLEDVPTGTSVALVLPTEQMVSGFVRRPNGTSLAGAKVQVVIDNVPSTTATTASDGSFTLRTNALDSVPADARVVVTPPATSGLPRLDETASLDLTEDVVVAYASTLATRTATSTIERSGGIANAKVWIVGTIPMAATITAGTGAAATALGTVRIAATTDGSGALPSTVVPAAELFAVVEAAPGDHAVVPFDTRTAVPASIVAPPMTAVSTRAVHAQLPVPGARLELLPIGPLGIAGVGSAVLFADETGTITGTLPAGALYTARFSDPNRTAGILVESSIGAATLVATYALPEAMLLTGKVVIQGGGIVPDASIEVFCNTAASCVGIERTRALGEGATDALGGFEIAVEDPAM